MRPTLCKTTADLTAAMGALQSEEAELTVSLSALLASTAPVDTALQRLSGLTSRLDEMKDDAQLLHQNVQATAKTADRVGSRVKALDEEMRRVREASERVGLVMELKVMYSTRSIHLLTSQQSSLLELHAAIDAQEWEAAARYCARAMTIPHHVVNGAFAESVVVRRFAS